VQPRFIKVTGRREEFGDIIFNVNCIAEMWRIVNTDGCVKFTIYGTAPTPTTISSMKYNCTALEHFFVTEVRIQSPDADLPTEGRRVEL